MLSANPHLLRSTPDLSTFGSTTRNMPNDQWRTSSGSSLHRSRSSRSARSSVRSPRRDSRSIRGSEANSVTRSALSANTTPVRRSSVVTSHHNRSQSFRNTRYRSPQQTQREARDAEGFRCKGVPSDKATYYQAKEMLRSEASADSSSTAIDSGVYDPRFEGDDECYLLRIFSITSKGTIVSQGDYVKQRAKHNNSFPPASSAGGSTPSVGSSTTSATSDSGRTPRRRIVLLGASGVGKSTLVTEFLTSEYMSIYDAQEEETEKSISVLLDGVEYELLFIENPLSTESEDHEPSRGGEEADAYVVVYSVTDRRTFQKSIDILFELKEKRANKVVILVGNKSDLARSREVSSEEGKATASSYECKFIETSACINHNVDELLVGIVSQIRLKTECKLDRRKNNTLKATESPLRKWGSTKATLRSSLKTKGIFHKILGKGPKKSKSCENLQVL